MLTQQNSAGCSHPVICQVKSLDLKWLNQLLKYHYIDGLVHADHKLLCMMQQLEKVKLKISQSPHTHGCRGVTSTNNWGQLLTDENLA